MLIPIKPAKLSGDFVIDHLQVRIKYDTKTRQVCRRIDGIRVDGDFVVYRIWESPTQTEAITQLKRFDIKLMSRCEANLKENMTSRSGPNWDAIEFFAKKHELEILN